MSARFALPSRLPSLRRATAAVLTLLLCGAAASRAAEPAVSWGRRSPVRHAVTADEQEKLARLAAPRAASAKALFGPPWEMSCGDLSLVLDGFGGFGSASAGGDAEFDAGDGPRATIYEAMAHLRGAGFLDADSMVLSQDLANSHRDGDAIVASYVRGPFRFDLRSRLTDCADPHSGALVQEWTITNVSTRGQNLGFTMYVDGDMFFAGDFRDDFGVRTDDALWQFDQASASAPSPYVALSSDAPQALSIVRQIGEYADQRRRINRNELLRDGLFRATGASADLDGDGVTDTGFDVSMALAHEFGSIAPGASVSLTTRITWGVGRIDDVVPQPFAVSLGADRSVECEGAGGTLVPVTAETQPAGAAAAWTWSVDGVPASAPATLDALLLPGSHVVAVTATDAHGHVAQDDVTITVHDTQAPEVEVAGEIRLWPPDHRLVPVELPVAVRDACSDASVVRAVSVESSEPDEVRHGGDGMFAGDAMVIDGRAWLRRERQGGGVDRTYVVHAEAIDESGNVTPFDVVARVPHDQH